MYHLNGPKNSKYEFSLNCSLTCKVPGAWPKKKKKKSKSSTEEGIQAFTFIVWLIETPQIIFKDNDSTQSINNYRRQFETMVINIKKRKQNMTESQNGPVKMSNVGTVK